MATVAVLGANGRVGASIADTLHERGHEVVAIGRDTGSPPTSAAGLRVEGAADVMAPGVLEAAVAGCQLAISAIGGPPGRAEHLVRVAADTGVHLVDVAPEQGHLRALLDRQAQVREAGVVVVPGAGLQHLIGDCLGHLAGVATGTPRELHVAYALPDRAALLADVTVGRRRSAATDLVTGSVALDRGELRAQLLGEHRRLAWFPRPIGPAHAAAIPGGEPLTVPLHLPAVATVRTYVALSGWRSELLQFTGNLARLPRPRATLVRRLSRPGGAPGPGRAAAVRWACVAEAEGDGGIARAWAYGRDPAGFTAVAAVAVGEEILAGGTDVGVVPPALLRAPDHLLDVLAARADLRWSLRRPGHGGRPSGV